MSKKLIIFGAGRNGDDAWNFFGAENIFCFVDNNKRLVGTKLRDKRIISPKELKKIKQEIFSEFDEKYEVIISVSKTRWATLAIVNQLQKMEIKDYSIYMDIRRRWNSGKEFIERNRTVYPHEQETILEIYKVQLDYLMRHIDGTCLSPATGSLRRCQLDLVSRVNMFFSYTKKLDIHPFMYAGTLLGAIRHKGFIPWDDDLDFALIYDEYVQLIQFLTKKGKIFYHCGNNVWKTKEGEYSCGLEYSYVAAYGFGYLQIYKNIGASHIKENVFVTDIFPIYYFAEEYSREDYRKDLDNWYQRREEDYDRVDEQYLKEVKSTGIIVKSSSQIGLGHDVASFLKSQHGINGRMFDKKFWSTDLLFPLQKLSFEGYEWYAPRCPKEWLEGEGYGDPMKLPERVGVYVHDKDRIFRDKY